MISIDQNLLQAVASGQAQLLDVREKEEWNAGHLRHAILLPLSILRSGKEIPSFLRKDLPTYLHCRSGKRVHLAAPLLQAKGFQTVIPLSQSFSTLIQLGFLLEDIP